jgi:hypothetical protein
MPNDPAIDAVRAARIQISRELGNDPVRLVAHYIELQSKRGGRIIRGPDDGDGEAAQRDVAADASASSAGGSRR